MAVEEDYEATEAIYFIALTNTSSAAGISLGIEQDPRDVPYLIRPI